LSVIQLPPRMQTVADLVPPGAKVVDVGTDHAYLPANLLQRGIIRRAVVSDLRAGPLSRARATAERYGLTELMDFRLCDGLAGILPEEADTIIIAGMGGETIAAILAAAPWTAQGERRLLLQPMTAQYQLRRWLQAHRYTIQREALSREKDSFYTILAAAPGDMGPMSPAQYWAGKQSREACSPWRGEYLRRQAAQLDRILAGLNRSKRAEHALRRGELEQIRQGIEEMREEWNTWQV